MELEISVREICNGLKSVRATDRKKNAEALKEFLTGSAVPLLLTKNTLQNKGYTWNQLFDDINEYILKETEKFETSKTYNNNIRPLCSTLLHSCVLGSNRGKAYIKCSKITETCLYILNDNRLVKAIGDEYLNLLFKHILSNDYYSSYITPNCWKDLLDVSIAACFSKDFKLDNYTKLRLVHLIMKSGRDNCQFVKPLMSSLSMVEKYISKVTVDKKAQDVLLEIIILLLETLSVECRLTMCHFTEKILPSIVKCYDQNKEQKKKSSLFKLLNLTIVLHHPRGRLQYEEGSLANDWGTWNKYMYSITEIICIEVGYLQKSRKQNDKALHHCTHFYQMAAFVHYQMFMAFERNENDAQNSTKRQKLGINKNKVFSDILNEMHQNHVPWLGIVHAYVQHYGTSVSASDFINLLNYMQVLLTNDNYVNWESFEELTCLALNNLMQQNNKEDEYENTLISLWNACARNCTLNNTAHKSVHTIMQCLLNSGCLSNESIQHFIKLYFEKDMPVTDYSLKTLNNVFHKFYNKYSTTESRIECFTWLTQGDISCIRVENISELVLRIIATENVHSMPICTAEVGRDKLRDIIFHSIDECILFSEFEKDLQLTSQVAEHIYEQREMIIDVTNHVEQYFRRILNESILKLRRNHSELLECTKLINIVLSYFDVIIKYKFKTCQEINTTEMIGLLKTALRELFSSLTSVLRGDEQITTKVAIISLVQELLMTEFDRELGIMLRMSIDGDFFHCVNNILNIKTEAGNNDIINNVNEREQNMKTLKHNCVFVLAAYCRQNVDYRDDILKLILNPDLYEFSSDMLCVFRCIDILKDKKVEEPPLDMIFTLMKFICKDWYRDAEASLGILQILADVIDKICIEDSALKENCVIMVKGYMKLSEDMHYSPQLASFIYECAAKIAVLNRKQNNYDETFERALTDKLRGDVHRLRLYCCYLLRMVVKDYSENDIETLSMDLLEIFVTDVLGGNELILKDESANRTLTVLHTFLALAYGKKSSIQFIILQILNVQHIKSLDKHIVKKVLNKIIEIAGIKDIQTYLNNNILPVIHFWFSNNYTVETLPLYLFGLDDLDLFIKLHTKWLVAADMLWRKEGNLTESDIVHRIINTQHLSIEHVLEPCFSNIMLLCLPYVVSHKYNLDCYGVHKPESFNKLKKYANKILHLIGEVFGKPKWNIMFLENIGEILLLVATHLSDHEDAERLFQVKATPRNETYYYPNRIFSAILDYFQALTDKSIISYLCHNQTTTIFEILLELWKNVVQENIFGYKILALHAYVTFIKNVPLDCPSDVFICNFVCKGFTYAIRSCCDKEELRVYLRGLTMCLQYLSPSKIRAMRKSVLELLPVLIIKKEEGYQRECVSILQYLNNDMRDCSKEGEDIVDFFSSISQGTADSVCCSSMEVFMEKIKAYKISLKCPSHETLQNLRQFLKRNKHFVHNLWSELDSKRFSEDCKTSVIHQFVHSLSCILKSVHDDKTIIEACNCLSEIGSFDLKTLVTVPPADPQELVVSNPKEYFAVAVVQSLLEVMFDKDPLVISRVTETLTRFLKCRRVENILDLDEVQNAILKPFMPATSTYFADTKVDRIKVEEYSSEFANGVFLDALVLHGKNSDDWLKRVTRALLRFIDSPTKDIDILREVCTLKSQVCGKILPALVGLLLHCLPEQQIKNIGEQINNFFNYIWDQTFEIRVQDSGDSRASSRPTDELFHDHNLVVQHMLDIVDFIRVQRSNRVRSGSPLKKLNYLELAYDKIAWAAAGAHQYWAAIYYGELWAVLQNSGVAPASPESTTRLVGGENLQKILRKCYVSIGEIDAIEGCGTAHLTIEDEKRKHLANSGKYSDALLLYDIALSSATQVDQDLHLGVVRTLHKSGMHHLALQYIKSQPDNEKLSDVKYECLSFLGDWSEFVDPRELEKKSKQANCHQNSIVKAFQYVCLKNCFHIQNTPEHENKVLLPINAAKLAVSRLCQNLNMENCQNVYKILAKIHLFNDIEDYVTVRTNKSEMSRLLQQWDIENLPQLSDFKHLETLISQRVLILEHAAKFSENLLNEISSLQIQYVKMALSNHRVEMAQRLLTIAKKSMASKDIVLMESEILWAKGHKDIALSLLQSIVINQSQDTKLTAVSLRQYALWIAELKRDNPRDIINKYLIKSLRELKTEDVDTRLKVYHDIAKFADAEYKQVVAYMNSSVFENRVKCVENMKGTASSLSEKQKKTAEELKALSSNKQFQALDEAEIANTRMEKDNFLRLAMRYYLFSLNQCNENNLSVFRVISLWLDNRGFNFKSNDGDSAVFEELLHTIPSWKYITALPQLAPHLSNEDNAFIENLKKIINRCAIEHPHHTMPILFGLKNSKKDHVILNASRDSSVRASRALAQDPRTLAARALVRRLAERGGALARIIEQMEKLCDAIISFANYKVKTKVKNQAIPDAEMIHRLRDLDAIPIPTATIRINADCNYSYIHTLKSFETRFELVGGINCPKKINCRDSAGNNHVMLIKGRDDLRQDAVMQQVFSIMNTLLEKDPVTNRNKLLIRTYKVVPMSRQSGVLEWCEGTITLGSYLIGAHGRYRPQDISCDIARKKLIECHKESNEEKLRAFSGILRQFRPVFNHFFTEHYLDPVTWYERRLAYTKSVATSSMLGYILGLGDRHVFNILIDERTAEVIHIDLGISFDQGKTLPTPETIPFRLTQDIISGFGSCGVEGIFRRCCEKTMQLLRDNQGTLLTILEVLLCDPLYSWSVKTAQQNAPIESGTTKEITTTDSNSGLAKRALLVVESKLSGTEAGVAGGVAVGGQVARLVHQATDPFNLCRVYNGWQPYF